MKGYLYNQIKIMKSSFLLFFILILGQSSFCQTNDSTAIVRLLEKNRLHGVHAILRLMLAAGKLNRLVP
jgi:hypothetical protein